MKCITDELKKVKDRVLIQYLYSIDTLSQEEKEEEQEQDKEKDKYELPLLKCVEIALRDEKYARLNKLVAASDFDSFILKLEKEGVYNKTPIEFKAHFVRWRELQPKEQKEIPIRPQREQDKWF
jgi:hypothetical protein